MDSRRLLSIEEVNDMEFDEFKCIFGNAIELCPEAAHAVATKRPFADTWQLCQAFSHYLDSRPEKEQVEILRLHPDLAARLTVTLTPESSREQAAAGLRRITEQEGTILQHYNKQYREKFGFPFIICARENEIKSIIDQLMKRYVNHLSQEIENAKDEVKKICKLRILDIVENIAPTR